MDIPKFHPLAADEPETYRLPDNSPVELMGADKRAQKATKPTSEAPCSSDGSAMNADSISSR